MRTSSDVSELSSCLTEARRSGACEDEDQLTYGKYASSDLSEEVLRKVKFSECSLAELCLSMATDAASNPSIEKETVGSHSVTYRGSTDSISGWSARIRETASRYLMTTGLLYRGAILRFKL